MGDANLAIFQSDNQNNHYHMCKPFYLPFAINVAQRSIYGEVAVSAICFEQVKLAKHHRCVV
jgi:hypothetical protein